MLKDVLIELYERDLNRVKAEIEQYASDEALWKTSGEIANSAGNLTLHITGNLKHFIGAVLGGSGYVRNRDEEFSKQGISRDKLLAETDETAAVVKSSLEKLTEEVLAANYPIDVFGQPMTTAFFLVHLTTHLNYHLGQINYHRRLLLSA